jgi:2-polyprenyl-3-methyl-5-hydroxy-6-metoxy-1,4-benzoquinol methylase
MLPSPIAGLLRCSACAFHTANLNLSNEELAALYSEKYFNGHEYANYLADRHALEKSFRRRLQMLLKYTPHSETKNLYEVGCAYGLFLNLARTHYRSVSGIDISSAAVDFAKSNLRLDVHCGDLLSSALPERIDVACLWDTIEHLSQPHLYLAKLTTAMPKGGIVAITTGDIESTVARWRGKKWRQIHPPTHLQYFSRNTLSTLLERHGFAVRYAGFDGMYRSAESMSYIIFALKQQRIQIHNALKRLGILNVDLYLNLRDILFVIAEKQA